MNESRAPNSICWDELPPEEILILLNQAAGDGVPAVSGFVDTHQWVPLLEYPNVVVRGGFPQAQFRRISFDPGFAVAQYLRLEKSQLPEGLRTAKQLRAWLYRNGMPDSSLGDIVIGDFIALAAVPEVDFSVTALPFSKLPGWQMPEVQPQRATAASRRADAVVSTVFSVSRGEAQTAIKFGFVFVECKQLTKRTREIASGEQLVYRTKGRAAVLDLETNPRSGRVWVSYLSYPA